MASEKRMIYADDALAAEFTIEEKGAIGYVVDSEVIRRLPTVDAVEVVRCKDCKNWSEDQYGCVCNLHSEKENEDYPAFEVQMLPDDFCSYGERKAHARKAD